jgi:hypothetical protein
MAVYDVFYFLVRRDSAGPYSQRQAGFDRAVGPDYLNRVTDSLGPREYAVACRGDAPGTRIIDPHGIAPGDE